MFYEPYEGWWSDINARKENGWHYQHIFYVSCVERQFELTWIQANDAYTSRHIDERRYNTNLRLYSYINAAKRRTPASKIELLQNGDLTDVIPRIVPASARGSRPR